MKKWKNIFLSLSLFTTLISSSAEACTGITLTGADNAVVFGRTVEWGMFDLDKELKVVPRGHEEISATPTGIDGKKWKTKYGYVGVDTSVGRFLIDGLNEEGLHVGAFYHVGQAEYMHYNPRNKKDTIDPAKLTEYLLGNYKTVEEVEEALKNIDVVGVDYEELGHEAPLHFIVTEESGKSIVVEFTNKEAVVYQNKLGVITNAPNYDWHMTNLRNYVGLTANSKAPVGLNDEVTVGPTGAGSGFLGLPGDFTPASRFVRAVAFSQTARETETVEDTLDETFRILDNFNVPAASAEGVESGSEGDKTLKSATQVTVASDTRNRAFYFHTQNDRRVKKVDLQDIDFDKVKYSQYRLDNGSQAIVTLEIK